MYKKLRRKFLWGSAMILLAVIAVVTGIVYQITSAVIRSQTNVLIELILENGGELPEHIEFAPGQERFLALSAESIYETRFISAVKSGDAVELTSVRIMMPENEAKSIAESAFDSGDESGRISVPGKRIFRFSKKTAEDGSETVVIIDSTSRYAMQKVTMMYMAAIWLVVLIIYVIVMMRYSKKIIKPLVENDEKQKRFITNASHELKTPLAVIAANTEMAEAVGGKTKWSESTRRQLTRMQTLIEELVVLSRADEMKAADMTEIDLSAVTAECAETFRSVAEGSLLTFETDISEGVTVRGDKRSLQHVVSILIDNAVKYCDKSGVVSIILHETFRGKGAKLTVSNTFAEGKDLDTSRFFERFYRQDESHNSEKAGFGIGLSMAKEITEKMKGKISVGYNDDTISFTVEI